MALIIAILLFSIALLLFLRLRSPHRLPPGPTGLPLLGALPLIGPKAHSSLAALALRYGPIMYLKMGTSRVVVASSPSAARSFLKTLDLQFANRPPIASSKHITYNRQNFVFSDYGPRWRLTRKLLTLHMLGNKAMATWACVRNDELHRLSNSVLELSREASPVALLEMMICCNANIIGRVLMSKRLFEVGGEGSVEFKRTIMELLTGTGMFNIGDFVPSIAWMDLQGVQRRLYEGHKKLDALVSELMREHEEMKGMRERMDFLDLVMQNRVDGDGVELSDTNIKALIFDMFAAGTDTSAAIVEWAIAEMLKNPAILNKAQIEMDQLIGKHRFFEESDIHNLPYLQAIVKEALRLHPSTPLSLPHFSFDPCEVEGYHIPKNTRLLINVWAIGRDPKVWENPNEFIPERFLTGMGAKIEAMGNDFELIPFGAGRRICAGMQAGMYFVQNLIGSLVHGFNWRLADGEVLDMEEKFGLLLPKAVPLKLVAMPRLTPEAYRQSTTTLKLSS